jgi:hypothetical protein
MVRKNISKQNNEQILLDKNHAQILIEVDSEINAIEKACWIIGGLGIHIIETKKISSTLTLLKLNVKDMGEIVLKLIENVFSKLKDIMHLFQNNK